MNNEIKRAMSAVGLLCMVFGFVSGVDKHMASILPGIMFSAGFFLIVINLNRK